MVRTSLPIALVLACALTTACSSSSSGTAASSTGPSVESAMLTTANTAINTAGTSSDGVLNGTGSTASVVRPFSLPGSFTTSTICTHSGDVDTSTFATNMTPGWAIARVYCNFAMRPDGPDTVRGGLDRTSGLMCALGNNITYDGQPHSVNLTIDSNCFGPAFIAIACPSASSCSGTASVTAYTPTQYVTAGFTTPTGFNKMIALTVTVNGSSLYNTIAISDSDSTKRAIAINYALPDGSHDGHSTLSVYMNSTTGVVRYEGRFAGGSDYDFRHLRAQINGTVDSTTFALSNITTMQFIEGDNFQTNNSSAFYLSLTGTAGAGRVIGYANNTYSSGWAGWSTGGDDNTCYGSGCGSPLAPASGDDDFITQTTLTDAWFGANAFLDSVAATIPVTDLWN